MSVSLQHSRVLCGFPAATQSISTCWHPPKAHVSLPAATSHTRPAHTHTLCTPYIYTTKTTPHTSLPHMLPSYLTPHTTPTACTHHTHLPFIPYMIYHTSLSIHKTDHVSHRSHRHRLSFTRMSTMKRSRVPPSPSPWEQGHPLRYPIQIPQSKRQQVAMGTWR